MIKFLSLRLSVLAGCRRPRRADHLRSGVQNQPGQHGETSSQLKIQKSARMMMCICSPSYSGGWGRRIPWTWEAEVAVSWDHATALQPGSRVSKTSTTTKEKQETNKTTKQQKRPELFEELLPIRKVQYKPRTSVCVSESKEVFK